MMGQETLHPLVSIIDFSKLKIPSGYPISAYKIQMNLTRTTSLDITTIPSITYI
jgi:hypothetical protein